MQSIIDTNLLNVTNFSTIQKVLSKHLCSQLFKIQQIIFLTISFMISPKLSNKINKAL